MKQSCFNRIVKLPESHLLFNSYTCALAEIYDKEYKMLTNIYKITSSELDEETELISQFIRHGFIVKDDVDEVKLLQYDHFKEKYSNNAFGLTIGVTLDCNFRCPYCYENRRKGALSVELQDKIVEMVKSNAKRGNHISITWYGGEPTLYFSIVESLSRKFIKVCEDNNVIYSAGMISNGYLITDEMAKTLKELKVAKVQITIDGPPEVHNIRRALPNGGDTFYRILESVKHLQNNGIYVPIRVNVDKNNEMVDLDLLTGLMKDYGIDVGGMYLGHVKVLNDKLELDSCISLTPVEFIKKNLESTFQNEKLTGTIPALYPTARKVYCGAQYDNNFVLDPDGYLYKCWDDIGIKERAVMNVLNSDIANTYVLSRYMLKSPFDDDKCNNCYFLPTCLGGCPSIAIKGSERCEIHTYSIDDIILQAYKQVNLG